MYDCVSEFKMPTTISGRHFVPSSIVISYQVQQKMSDFKAATPPKRNIISSAGDDQNSFQPEVTSLNIQNHSTPNNDARQGQAPNSGMRKMHLKNVLYAALSIVKLLR